MAPPETDHDPRDALALRRLSDLARRLSDAGRPVLMSDGWTASAVFAHLAFWDRFVLARWDQYDSSGIIEDLPEGHLDLVNSAALPLWLALEAGVAISQAIEAATAVADRIAALSPDAVDYARRTGRPAMLDRTLHWSPHLDELSAALDPARRPDG